MKYLKLIIAFLFMGVFFIFCNCKKEESKPIIDAPESPIDYGNFEFDGNIRAYQVIKPSNYSSSANLPVVIYLHAYTSTFTWGKGYTAIDNVADTAGYLLLGPTAIDETWNSGIGDNPDIIAPDVDDVGFINALIDTVINNYSVDPDRIYICGFSNGGFMTYMLACQLSHRIAAVASVGGGMFNNIFNECDPQHPMPLLHITGTADQLVYIDGNLFYHSTSEVLSYWADINICTQIDTTLLPDLDLNDECTVQKIRYSNCSNDIEILYFKVIEGGHTWPGATFEIEAFGKRNGDFNASKEILNFFDNYTLN